MVEPGEAGAAASLSFLGVTVTADYVRLAGIILSYIALTLVAAERRKVIQRKLFKTVRQRLADFFQLPKLAELDENAVELGSAWRVLSMTYVTLIYLLSIAFLFEGRVKQAINLSVLASTYGLASVKLPRSFAVVIARGGYVHQIVSLVVLMDTFETAMLSRAVITRAFSSVVLFELADETFFHMFSMTMVFAQKAGWTSSLATLPVRTYFLFLLPMHILGLREWIASKGWFDEKSRENKREFFAAICIPLMTVLFSFSSGVESDHNRAHIFFLQMVGILSFALFVVCVWFGDVLDEYVMGDLFLRHQQQKEKTKKSSGATSSGDYDGRDAKKSVFSIKRAPSIAEYVSNLLGSSRQLSSQGKFSMDPVAGRDETLESEEDDDNDDDHGANNDFIDERRPQTRSAIARIPHRLLRRFFRLPRFREQESPFQSPLDDPLGGSSQSTAGGCASIRIGLMDVIFVATTASMTIFCSPGFLPGMGLLFLAGRHPRTRILRARWRTVVFVTHTLMLGYTLHGGCASFVSEKSWKARSAMVLLMTVRMLFAFEKRRFSFIERESALIGTIVCFMVHDNELVSYTVFFLISTYVIAVIVGFSREHSAEVLRKEDGSHAFLFHALKQKFSGVGSAAEHILELRCFRNNGESGGESSLTNDRQHRLSSSSSPPAGPAHLKSLLQSILLECRKGQDACHSVNVLRNIRQGRYSGQKSFGYLKDVLGQWSASGNLQVKAITYAGDIASSDYSIEAELNWELFRLLLSQWARGATSLHVQVFLHDMPRSGNDDRSVPLPSSAVPELDPSKSGLYNALKDCDPVTAAVEATSVVAAAHRSNIDSAPHLPLIAATCEMRFEVFSKRLLTSDRKSSMGIMANELGGFFLQLQGKDVLFLRRCPARVERDHGESGSRFSGSLDTPGSSRRTLGEDASTMDSIPNGLRFAILDDNALVRKNVFRIVMTHLHGEQHSFAHGSTYEECLRFADEIIDRDVDIVILDENLDFDDNRLSGTDIARIARQKGFTGCLLLHSAQAGSSYDPSFNGFVEKTASRRDFAHGVLKGWQSFNSKNVHLSRRKSSISSSEIPSEAQ